jgi:DNA-binding NarL/FixJ family response regulator
MQPITILIADDDHMVRQCLRRAVEQDIELRIMWEADNGLQALHMAKEFHPQVVLLDAQMPRMDGIEATRILRQRDHGLRILVMGLDEHMRAQALAAGADAFLTKDISCDVIRSTIRRIIEDNTPGTN